MHRPLNIIQPPRQPINRPRPRAQSSSNAQSAPQWRHSRWTYFLSDLNEIIMQHTPSLRPHFLELLSRIDTI